MSGIIWITFRYLYLDVHNFGGASNPYSYFIKMDFHAKGGQGFLASPEYQGYMIG